MPDRTGAHYVRFRSRNRDICHVFVRIQYMYSIIKSLQLTPKARRVYRICAYACYARYLADNLII